MQGIKEQVVTTPEEMHGVIEFGHKARTTHSTVANNTSSRSHAICQIYVTKGGKFCGKLILCDLAGSERAADTQSNSRQRRLEGAEINKSLLALKECIRAMNAKKSHIPFRASKLTLALRDSFLTQNVASSKIVMIACVCPGSKSSDHTINTLRYADRLKEK
jgi:kinesin family protein 2/24